MTSVSCRSDYVDSPAFFQTLFEYCEGTLEIRILDKRHPEVPRIFLDPSDASGRISFCKQYIQSGIFYGVGTRNGEGGTKAHLVNLPACWLDLDFRDTPLPVFQKKFSSFPLQPTMVVQSGGGLHIYFKLKEPAGPAGIPSIEAVNRSLASYLGGDMNSVDASRVLRVPGSINQKYPRPVDLVVLNRNEFQIHDFDFLPEVTTKTVSRPTSPEEFDNTDEVESLLQCDFMRWARDHQGEVSEPLWYALLSNLVAIRPGGVSLCHEFSKAHPKYTRRETDEKVLHALNGSKPHKCSWIRENGFECKRNCGVPSPSYLIFNLQLKEQETDGLRFIKRERDNQEMAGAEG